MVTTIKSNAFKITLSIITLIATIICSVFALNTLPETTTSFKLFGTFLSFIFIVLITFKLPERFYYLCLLFHFLSSSLGSVFNLYSNVSYYDRVIHFFSGIVLAYGGKILLSIILKTGTNSFCLLFAFIFSSACAGFWEIYEFTADNLLGTVLQGDNFNTMGDIVCGVSGALVYVVSVIFMQKIKARTK